MRTLLAVLLSIVLLVVFCEFFLYYLVLLRCTWPSLTGANLDPYAGPPASDHSTALKVLVLSDPHIQGRRSHRVNRIFEWHMERSFKTLLFIHRPDVVFILGDLIDEGMRASKAEFLEYVDRFNRVFPTDPVSYTMKVVAGNHDIGFHYEITYLKDMRFRDAFYGDSRTPTGRIFSKNGVHFVLMNSMAFEGDDCQLCAEAKQDLASLAKKFRCLRGDDLDASLDCNLVSGLTAYDKIKRHYDVDSEELKPGNYSRPILLQHFPLYRPNDSPCPHKPQDAMPREERLKSNRQRWECLSKEASDSLLTQLQPRLVLSGHTHYSCRLAHPIPGDVLRDSVREFSVASFNSRNLEFPSALLLRISPYDYAVNKCYLPSKWLIVYVYIVGALLLVAYHTRLFPFLLRVIGRYLNRVKAEGAKSA